MTDTLDPVREIQLGEVTLALPAHLQSPDVDQIMPDLIAAKKAFDRIVKDTVNTFFNTKYADLEEVLKAVGPSLLDNGIALLQQTYVDEQGRHVLWTRLLHVSGQYLGSLWLLKPTKDDPQGHGSALTYGRRYQAQAITGVASEDDDGNASVARPARQGSAPRDFEAELEKCTTVQQVMDLGRAAGAVGEWDRLQAKFVAKRDELQKAEAEAAEAKANQAAAGEPGPEAGAVSGSP